METDTLNIVNDMNAISFLNILKKTDVKNLTKLACSYLMSPTALENFLHIEVLKTSYPKLHVIYSWIFNSCFFHMNEHGHVAFKFIYTSKLTN